MSVFSAYPFATASALLTYILCACLLLPGVGPVVRALFSHPIPPTQKFLAPFDTLRGFAALLVAVGHLWYFAYPITAPIQLKLPWIAYGAKAVPMFAMLSGFLIYRSVRNIDSIEKVREYLYRRFFRIYPLYTVSVLGMLLVGQTQTTRDDYGMTNYVVAELFMFRVFDAPFFSNPATWSLYVEILFYAFMPLYIFMVPKGRMILVTAILAGALTVADQWHVREFYMWKYFFFGILVSELALKSTPRPAVGASFFGLGLVWLGLDMLGPRFDVFRHLGLVAHNQSEYTLGLGIAFGLILYSVCYAGPATRLLNAYPLRFVGIISYSLFLLHPFYLLVNFPPLKFFMPVPIELWKTYPVMPSWFFAFVYVPGVFVWAAVGFLVVERPGLQFGRRWLCSRTQGQALSARTDPAEA